MIMALWAIEYTQFIFMASDIMHCVTYTIKMTPFQQVGLPVVSDE